MRPWDRNKGGKPPYAHAHNGMEYSHPESHAKRSDVICHYCGKPAHFVRDCYNKKYNEEKQRKHAGHFYKGEEENDFQNLRLFLLDVAMYAETDDSNAWFVDSGASIHMSCNKEWFENYKETKNGAIIYLGDDHSHPIKGYGDISVTMSNGSVKQIQNVMHVLVIKKNSIFVSTIAYQYMKIEFVKSCFLVKDMQDHYKVISTSGRVGGLYKLNVMMNVH